MDMKPIDEGVSPVRSVRIPEALWSRLADWARTSGVGDADALRELLRLGLETPPGVVVRPVSPSLRPRNRRHACSSGGTTYDCAGGSCSMAWSYFPDRWLLARVLSGSDWSDLDDVLGCVPGAVRVTSKEGSWVAVPIGETETVRALFHGRADRVRVHSLCTSNEK